MRNVSFKCSVVVAAATVAILAAQGAKVAHAQTITTAPYDASVYDPSNNLVVGSMFTDTNGKLVFTQFDSSLGTLTGMTISLSGSEVSNYTIKNTGVTAMRGTVSTTLQFTITDPNPTNALPGGSLNITATTNTANFIASPINPNDTRAFGPLTGSGTSGGSYTSATNPSLLAEFTGPGTVALNFATTTTQNLAYNGGNAFANQVTQAQIHGTVTYTYTKAGGPPMPEPSALSLIGMVGVGGGVIRRLRRKAA